MIVNISTIYIDIILTRRHRKKGHKTIVRVMSLYFNNNSIFIYIPNVFFCINQIFFI